SWSVNVPSDVLTALGNGSLSVTATVTNGHGNTGTGEREIAIDANLPGLRVNTVAGDDVVNTIEHAQNLIVSGSSDGLAPGTALTVTVNGKDYAATVLADGTWSAAIPSADVSAWPEGTVKISVTGDSAAGNPITISHDVTVDLTTVAISINALATDDVINAAEVASGQTLSGKVSGAASGDTVTIGIGGNTYT
ncbi:Ig-like domain-containing protein, partial [Escherichia coli]|uniref:Ig-like domain-containing protein n=1 Tax=Escherichia coli TaxID=562 RepID=UPI0028A2006C